MLICKQSQLNLKLNFKLNLTLCTEGFLSFLIITTSICYLFSKILRLTRLVVGSFVVCGRRFARLARLLFLTDDALTPCDGCCWPRRSDWKIGSIRKNESASEIGSGLFEIPLCDRWRLHFVCRRFLEVIMSMVNKFLQSFVTYAVRLWVVYFKNLDLYTREAPRIYSHR